MAINESLEEDHGGVAKDYLLGNKTYDLLKRFCQLGLPAAGTLYFALATYWKWPNSEQVLGSIMAVNTFLGVLLGYSSKSYNVSEAKYDGTVDIEESEDGHKLFSLNLNGDPETLQDQQEIRFKVNVAA